MASLEQRREMCKLAFSDHPNVLIADLESVYDFPNYTYMTILDLKKRFAHDELFLLLGCDEFNSLMKWKNPLSILANCKIVVVGRRGHTFDNALYETSENIICCYGDTNISSTNIRDAIASNNLSSWNHGFTDKVKVYVEECGLYK